MVVIKEYSLDAREERDVNDLLQCNRKLDCNGKEPENAIAMFKDDVSWRWMKEMMSRECDSWRMIRISWDRLQLEKSLETVKYEKIKGFLNHSDYIS